MRPATFGVWLDGVMGGSDVDSKEKHDLKAVGSETISGC